MILFVPSYVQPTYYYEADKILILEQECCQPMIIKKDGQFVKMSKQHLKEILRRLKNEVR